MQTEKRYTFTVDDNIRFLRELAGQPSMALFDHPYMAMWLRLHRQFGVRVQLNLFFSDGGAFDLCGVPDRLAVDFRAASGWLRLSFHAKQEFPAHPYREAPARVLLADCQAVHREILRFAGKPSLAATTTLHYCTCTAAGLAALRQAGVRGLLGLFGTPDAPRLSYQLTEAECAGLRRGIPLRKDGMLYANIPLILNRVTLPEVSPRTETLASLPSVSLMIHEQYFYPDYRAYQPDFEEKVSLALNILTRSGYHPTFFESWESASPEEKTLEGPASP